MIFGAFATTALFRMGFGFLGCLGLSSITAVCCGVLGVYWCRKDMLKAAEEDMYQKMDTII